MTSENYEETTKAVLLIVHTATTSRGHPLGPLR